MNRTITTTVVAALCCAVFAGCSGGGSAAATPVPPVLPVSPPLTSTNAPSTTPQSVTTTLSDNFSQDTVGGQAAGWSVVSGTWSICSNVGAPAYCETAQATGEALTGPTAASNYTVDALVSDASLGTSGGVAVIGRATTPTRFYSLEIRPRAGATTPYWYLWMTKDGAWTALADGPLSAPDKNPNYHLNLAFSGTSITASIAFDGGTTYHTLASVIDATYPSGQVGVHTQSIATAMLQNITVTSPAVPLPTETAVATSTFVNSLGMNAHFESPTYYDNYTKVNSLVGALGVRHYRVSASNILFPNGGYAVELTALHTAYGTMFDVLSDLHTTPAQVLKAVSLLPANSVESVEGPNESDNPGQGSYYDPSFAIDVPTYMRALYTLVKSTPTTALLSVIGPSFINATSYAAVGNISGVVDEGNMHNYFAGFNPGTTGWGASGYAFAPVLNYGSIAWNMASAAQATGTKPIAATETGYYTAPIHSGVPLDVQAKYVPRLYLENYRHGVPRTYLYQLVGYNTTTADGTLDIVNPSYQPSPAYTALAAMIGILSDTAGTTATMPYSWSLSGQTTNVDHLLLHKTNGTMYLALWIETASFNPNANGGAGAEITVPAQSVKVTVAQNPANATLWTGNAQTGAWTSQPIAFTNGSVTLNVSDTVSILAIGAP